MNEVTDDINDPPSDTHLLNDTWDVVDDLSQVSILCEVGVIIVFTPYCGSHAHKLQTLEILLGDDVRYELVQPYVASKQCIMYHLQLVPVKQIRQLENNVT